MTWQEIRGLYPDRWLVIEAIEAHTRRGHRHIDRIAVLAVCPDGPASLRRYRELHEALPGRELYFVSTQRVELDIEDATATGTRTAQAYRDAHRHP